MLAFEFTTIPFRWERGVTHVCLRLVCCCVSLRSPSIGKWSVRRISGQKGGGIRNKKETKKKKKKTTTEKRKGKSNLSTSEGRHLWLRDWREDRETERAERVYVCSAVERSGGVYPKKKERKKLGLRGETNATEMMERQSVTNSIRPMSTCCDVDVNAGGGGRSRGGINSAWTGLSLLEMFGRQYNILHPTFSVVVAQHPPTCR